MTPTEVIAALERDGCCMVPGLLSGRAVDRARRDLRRVAATTPVGRDDFEGRHTRRVYALFAKTRTMDGAAIHPLVLAVLDHFLGHYQLSAPTGIEIGPDENAQFLHRDDAIYPVPDPHPELVLTVMWPLDEFTAANGGTLVVPGSHRRPGAAAAGDGDAVPVEMPAGSALFYLGSLLHGGGANRTRRPRLGVVMHYAASWLRPVETHVLAVPPATVASLPERLQELLGYNIHPPFLGNVDGRHPRRLLTTG